MQRARKITPDNADPVRCPPATTFRDKINSSSTRRHGYRRTERTRQPDAPVTVRYIEPSPQARKIGPHVEESWAGNWQYRG